MPGAKEAPFLNSPSLLPAESTALLSPRHQLTRPAGTGQLVGWCGAHLPAAPAAWIAAISAPANARLYKLISSISPDQYMPENGPDGRLPKYRSPLVRGVRLPRLACAAMAPL